MVYAITYCLHDIQKPKHTELLFYIILFVILKYTIWKTTFEMTEPQHDSKSIIKDLEDAILVIPINCLNKSLRSSNHLQSMKKHMKQS